MPIKLTSKEYGIVGVAIVVTALSLAVSVKYFWRAFPEASIDFQVDRGGSNAIAAKFLESQGVSLHGYSHAAIFDYDDTQKLYLERTQGLERMNDLTGPHGLIRIWRWANRWFKPLQKEEFRVDVTPSGDVSGFRHELPETAPGANLSPEEARRIAEAFLTEKLGRNLADWSFLDSSVEKRPARTDHTFTWIKKNLNLGDGDLRMEASVSGDQPSGYRQYVHIPDQWRRDYDELRSRNDSAQLVDEVFWILLSVAMIIVLIQSVRAHDVPVRLALGFGLTASALVFLDQLNSFSVSQFGYETTDTYSSFVGQYVLRATLSALGMGLAIFLIVAAAEPVYRRRFPQLQSIGRTFSWQGLRSKSFFMANVVGIAMTFFFFAYQTVFYLAANKMGAWAPSDVPFSDELNTAIPWVAVLFGGFAPAVLEEMQFRTFAIPFLQRLVRFWPAAIVLAAFNWGFLHSAYPNQPFFIRGVEVGLGGILVGVIMMRFGVIATMIWHYSVDAMYTAFILLRSPNFYLKSSGAITGGIMLVPLIVALIAYWRAGSFSDESALSNASTAAPNPPPEQAARTLVAAALYKPLSARKTAVGGALVIAFVALSLIPVHEFGENVGVAVSRDQAIAAAKSFLEARKLSLDGYRNAAWLYENVDASAVKYLFEHVSVERADLVYGQATRLLLWHVRYFRPLQKEEYAVFVDAESGQVFSFRHTLDENAPGVSLSTAEARTIAESAMQEHGYALGGFELEDSQSQKRKARVDYTFRWQAKPGDSRNIADAKFRVEVDLAGDEVVGFGRMFKLPEDWIRREESSGFGNTILIAVEAIFAAILLAAVAKIFIAQVRSGEIQWGRSGVVAGFVAIAGAVNVLTQLPVIDRAYDTSIPISTFHLFTAIGFIVGPLFFGLTTWILVGLSTSLFPEAWSVFYRGARKAWSRDAFMAIVLSLAVTAGMQQALAFIANWLHVWAPIDVNLAPAALDAYPPGLYVLLRGVLYAVGASATIGIAIYLVRSAWARRNWLFWIALALLIVALGPAGAHSISEYLTGWVIRFLPLAAGVIVIAEFFRDNIAAYVGAALCTAVFNPLFTLCTQPLGAYRWNAVFAAALVLLVLIWLLPRPFPASATARD